MSDVLAPDDGSGINQRPASGAPLAPGDAHDPSVATGTDGLVLHFPVEIEVRMVAAYDGEELVNAALDRFTTALQGLA